MNIPEPWREYPGAYDSHTEYLWNDTPFITSISTAAPLPATLRTAGSWAGATLVERARDPMPARSTMPRQPTPLDAGVGSRARLTATITTHRGFTGCPPAPRHRPASALALIQPLARPHQYHRRQPRRYRLDRRHGLSRQQPLPRLRHRPRRSSGRRRVRHRHFNDFRSPLAPTLPQGLVPSTVFAPTGALRNSGRYLNQPWLRWERFLDLRNGKFADGDTTYPLTGVGATTVPPSRHLCGRRRHGNAVRGLRASADARRPSRCQPVPPWPGQCATPGRGSKQVLWVCTPPTSVTVASRSARRRMPARLATGTCRRLALRLDRPQSRPRRFQLCRYREWCRARAYPTAGVLTQVLSWYGITVGGNDPKSVAWKGNRDGSPAPTYDMTVGTPAYVDTPTTRGDMTAGSTTVTLLGRARRLGHRRRQDSQHPRCRPRWCGAENHCHVVGRRGGRHHGGR